MVDHHRPVVSICILVLGLTSTQSDCTWLGPTHGFLVRRSPLAGLGFNARSLCKAICGNVFTRGCAIDSAHVTLLCFKRAKAAESLKFKARNSDRRWDKRRRMLLQGCVVPVTDHKKYRSKVSLRASEQGRIPVLGRSPGWLWNSCSARGEGNTALRPAKTALRHGTNEPAKTTSPQVQSQCHHLAPWFLNDVPSSLSLGLG